MKSLFWQTGIVLPLFLFSTISFADNKQLTIEFPNQTITPLVLFGFFNAGYITFTFNNKTYTKSVYVTKMGNISSLRSLNLRAMGVNWKVAGDDFNTRWIGFDFAIAYQNDNFQVAEVSDLIYLKGLGINGKVTQCYFLDAAKSKIGCDVEVGEYLEEES